MLADRLQVDQRSVYRPPAPDADAAAAARSPGGRHAPLDPQVRGGRLLVADAFCEAGDIATIGGFETSGTVLMSMGIGAETPTGGRAIASSDPDETTQLTVIAVCTPATSLEASP